MRLLTALLFIGALGGASTLAASAEATPAPAAPRTTEWREVTLPAGTLMPVTFDRSVGSDISRVEQPVSGHLSRPIVVHGDTVVPRGSRVSGVVTSARRSGKVKGRAYVAVRFTDLSTQGERYRLSTRSIGRLAPATKKADALKVAAPAAGGAALGAIVGGKKGAAIGTAVGGGAGTAVVLDTRGKEVYFARGSTVSVRLTSPLTVRVPR